MNSDPLSEPTPRIGNGITEPISASAAITHLRALFCPTGSPSSP